MAALDRVGGNAIALELRLAQEIERIDAEPVIGVVADATPHAEMSIRLLHVEHAVDRVLDAAFDDALLAQMPQERDVVEVEQRKGAARRLLEAAEGIAVERLQQACK